MTLGRSSTGAIKIKTDEAGGGLRAVNCACCGGGDCGCYAIQIPANLREIVSAGNVTLNGIPPSYFTDYGGGNWQADWLVGDGGGFEVWIDYIHSTGCIENQYIVWIPNPDDTINRGHAELGLPADCVYGEEPVAQGTFTINGEGEYNYYWYTSDPVAVPSFNFDFS